MKNVLDSCVSWRRSQIRACCMEMKMKMFRFVYCIESVMRSMVEAMNRFLYESFVEGFMMMNVKECCSLLSKKFVSFLYSLLEILSSTLSFFVTCFCCELLEDGWFCDDGSVMKLG